MSYPYKSHHKSPQDEGFSEKSQQSHREQPNPFSPSKMQVGFPNPQAQEPFQTSRRGQPSVFQRSQMQGGFPRSEIHGQNPLGTNAISQSQRNMMGQSQRNIMGQNTITASQSQRGYPGMQAGQLNVPQAAPTVTADARPSGRSVIIRPGEPHHFGCREDFARGEYINTLCRCNNPMSHGDAYTMCDSWRGNDIHGNPIDWQTAKMRMLDLYGRDQISHQEEMAAVPYIYDAHQAATALRNEEEVKASIRMGFGVVINTAGNNVTWHNEDGHAKPYATADGLCTKFDRSGYGPPFGQSRRG